MTTARRIDVGDHQFDFGVSLSPDGKYLTGINWDGDLMLIDAQSREQRKLSDSSWGNTVWSPDGKRLAINSAVREPDGEYRYKLSFMSLAIINMTGRPMVGSSFLWLPAALLFG